MSGAHHLLYAQCRFSLCVLRIIELYPPLPTACDAVPVAHTRSHISKNLIACRRLDRKRDLGEQIGKRRKLFLGQRLAFDHLERAVLAVKEHVLRSGITLQRFKHEFYRFIAPDAAAIQHTAAARLGYNGAVEPRYRSARNYPVTKAVEHRNKASACESEFSAVFLKISDCGAVFIGKRMVNIYRSVKIAAYQPAVKFTHISVLLFFLN